MTTLPNLLVYLVPKPTLDFNTSDPLGDGLGNRDLLSFYSVLKQLLSGKQLWWKVALPGYHSRYDPASRNSTVLDGLSLVPLADLVALVWGRVRSWGKLTAGA